MATETLARNLAALRKGSPDAVARVEGSGPHASARVIATEDGAWTVEIGEQALASRRRPLQEAEKFADGIDPKRAAILVVAGFGAGHHVRAVAERMGRTGMVVVFEPDVELLRTVLERADCSEWLTRLNVAVLTDADDGAAMAEVVRGLEGLVAMGVELVEHPASRARLGVRTGAFHRRFVELVRTLRMTVTTTLVQVPTTLSNATQNIDHYALARAGGGAGIDELAGVCAGRAGIVVSAGPGLAECLPILARPEVRERCLIVAVQTVLKTLLRAGVRPHVVTALDYSEISARFYEGLSERDLEGITLVVEPKVNPAVTSAFKGRIRCAGDANLDRLLGSEIVGERARLEQGATVAHLAYYLARHCGCDPVGLVGQDLAFTDGAYYGAGAAIHGVWASELNAFTSLELMEWLRIVRMGGHLRRARDVLGREVFTDEQMDTYRVQFERDFKVDGQRGLRVFDCGGASAGSGVRKQHAEPVRLEAFVERFAGRSAGASVAEAMEKAEARGAAGAKTVSRKRLLERVSQVRLQAWRFGEVSRRAESALTQMLEHHADQVRVNKLIGEVESMRREVATLEPAAFLVHTLNQSGSLERMRADRRLQLEMAGAERDAARGVRAPMDPFEAQRRTIERDIRNVRGLSRSADELVEMLRAAEESLNGAPKRVRRVGAGAGAGKGEAEDRMAGGGAEGGSGADAAVRVEALVLYDTRRTALGLAREGSWRGDGTALAMCVRRLRETPGLDGVRVLTDDAARAAEALGAGGCAAGVEIEGLTAEEIRALDGPGWRAIRSARALAASCWRGAPGGLTVHDEAIEPVAMARVMRERGIDAALVVHADAALVCPDRCGALVARHRADPATHRLTFSQDPAGVCGALLSRSLMEDMAGLRASGWGAMEGGAGGEGSTGSAGKFAGLSGGLAYVPSAPAMDLIAQSLCVETPPEVRDLGWRLMADSASGAALVERVVGVLERMGVNAGRADSAAIARAVRTVEAEGADGGLVRAAHAVVCVGRGASAGGEAAWASVEAIASALTRLRDSGREVLAVTLAGEREVVEDRLSFEADPLEHPEGWRALLGAARSAAAGAVVHVRTRLAVEEGLVRALVLEEDQRPEAISVDLLGESARTYAEVCGRDEFGRARRNMETLVGLRASVLAAGGGGGAGGASSWWGLPVVVARMVRCDAAYGDVESFVNRWMTHADWAAVDPLPSAYRGPLLGRIAPLPVPESARARLARERVVVDVSAEGMDGGARA